MKVLQSTIGENLKTTGLLFLCLIFYCSSCQQSGLSKKESDEVLNDQQLFLDSFDDLTDVIVHDIFSPPVASRVYVYPCIAAYEVIASGSSEHQSLSHQLNSFELQKLQSGQEDLNFSLAAIAAFILTSKELVFSQDVVDKQLNSLRSHLDSIGISQSTLDKSIQYGRQYSEQVLAWAKLDNYAETRSSPKYNISDDPGRWKPTPPAFMEGIEPHWRDMRKMVIQNLDDYKAKGTVAFSSNPQSEFYKQVLEAKNAVDEANEEHRNIAAFWDCNPYVMNISGHMMFASKKITPGGHWMGICSTATKQSNLNFAETVEIHTRTAIAIYDAFISCWDEKYSSNLVRPETVINDLIDQDWKPILQTPPFPEYTSGHSVISTAASVVLTDYFGENYSYIDDVELKYGLPSRSFTSFEEAASEAAISRLYGGIHYRPAIDDGVEQGKLIGAEIVKKLKTSVNKK